MSNGVYGNGMQLEDSEGNLYIVDEYTEYGNIVKFNKKYTLINTITKNYRMENEFQIIREFRIPRTPYKVGQKIQDTQGNIYSINRAYMDEEVVNRKTYRYLTFQIKKDWNLRSSKKINGELITDRYKFSVRVGDLEVNEKYKFDNYENMELVSKKFDKDKEIYNLKFKNAETKDEVPIEVENNFENKYRFYQYPPRETWRNVEGSKQNVEESQQNVGKGGNKTRRKKLTTKRKKSSKQWTRKRKMSSKVLRGH